MKEILAIGLIFLGVIFLAFIICGFVYLYQVNIGEANIITVYCNNEEIYQGKKAFVDITSGGMTTTITIYRQLFPFKITDKIYSSGNIEVN